MQRNPRSRSLGSARLGQTDPNGYQPFLPPAALSRTQGAPEVPTSLNSSTGCGTMSVSAPEIQSAAHAPLRAALLPRGLLRSRTP